jgi:hypothetical protein
LLSYLAGPEGVAVSVAVITVVWLDTTVAVVEYVWYPDRLRTRL